MFFSNQKTINLSDKAKSQIEDDELNSDKRIVEKIYQFLHELGDSQLTIAITGEWGVGKSTVLNFLQNRLKENSQNIVIVFDPLCQ